MRKHKTLNAIALIVIVASLLMTCAASGLVQPRLAVSAQNARSELAAPVSNVAAAPISPTDESKVPHYFGP